MVKPADDSMWRPTCQNTNSVPTMKEPALKARRSNRTRSWPSTASCEYSGSLLGAVVELISQVVFLVAVCR